jgi:hypothetical protein
MVQEKLQGRTESYPVDAATTIPQWSSIGINAATGGARVWVAGDEWAGLAASEADNSAGILADKLVEAIQNGQIIIPVASATIASTGAEVQLATATTYSVGSPAANSRIGHIVKFLATPAATSCLVKLIGHPTVDTTP